ncbi:MAG TPA: EamA family transporter [Candidatus Limnocylindrales bacterium]|jgi:drug/metabolite transporter (DMT)-like permease
MQTASHRTLGAPGTRVALALGALYVVWGSTYLAIRVAVETIPPFMQSSIRFLIAGTILALVTAPGRAGEPRPGRREWRDAAIIGGFLLVGGNGLVALGETTVGSGIAALLIATLPLWVAVLGRLFFNLHLARSTVAGIALGFVGVGALVWPAGGSAPVDLVGAGILLGSPILWAIGSLYSARAHLPARPLVGVAMQMLCGGVMLGVVATLSGEVGRFHPAAVTPASIAALAYLVAVGSLVGFTAYAWLLRVAPLSLVATYAYVNPIVAVALGALILGEPVTPRTLLAGVIIILAVAIIVWARGREPVPPRPEEVVEAT